MEFLWYNWIIKFINIKYGVDVASLRADDLDKLMLKVITARSACGESLSVLDIGCASGAQSWRMSKAGAKVTGLDIADFGDNFSLHIEELKQSDWTGELKFVQAGVMNWLVGANEEFDIVCCQRMLHYLPYRQAKILLKEIAKMKDVILYLSVTGATSAIATNYTELSKGVDDRFGHIEETLQAVFSITAPVCLYYESELLELLRECGFEIKQSRVSDFGNIKVVAKAI